MDPILGEWIVSEHDGTIYVREHIGDNEFKDIAMMCGGGDLYNAQRIVDLRNCGEFNDYE
jgi:hypothetical protein